MGCPTGHYKTQGLLRVEPLAGGLDHEQPGVLADAVSQLLGAAHGLLGQSAHALTGQC
ncbi:hypothetical protein D3C78_1351600 [compost metagenome]